MIKIDEEGKITIRPQLLRSMSTRSDWGEGSLSAKEELEEDDIVSMTSEMSKMSFEAARPSVHRIMSPNRKVIGYKTRTVSEPIYEDELVKNMTTKICYEATNINPNSCLLYTSPSPRDGLLSRMPSSA